MDKSIVEVTVPGSTANLGPGFDSIGMALNLFTKIQVQLAESTCVHMHGEALSGVPADGNNLIVRAMKHCFAEQGKQCPPVHVDVWSDIPLTRGLGSSSAALVAGLAAANVLTGNTLSQDDLMRIGTAWEGHPDNIGPSLFGGVVIGSWDGKRVAVVQVPPPQLDIVVAIPHYEVSTDMARHALPENILLREAVLSSSRANLLTAALIQDRPDLLETAMQDSFHQPYRTRFIPGMGEILANARDHGAFGIALSGSGPTLLAFARDREALSRYLMDAFAQHKTDVTIKHLMPWGKGAEARLTANREMCKVSQITPGK